LVALRYTQPVMSDNPYRSTNTERQPDQQKRGPGTGYVAAFVFLVIGVGVAGLLLSWLLFESPSPPANPPTVAPAPASGDDQ
jgi:hypothetical protein